MRVLVEYQIISGRTVEKRRSYMNMRKPGEPPKGRAPRVAGNTSEKKIKQNRDAAVRTLAQILNCNTNPRDLHIVARYDNEHLPKSYEEAEAVIGKVINKARYKFKKAYGRNPKIVWNTADWSPKSNRPARLHHHIVAEAEAEEALRAAWDEMKLGDYSVNFLDSRADHSELAAYLIANVTDAPNRKKYHCTRNMDKPIITEPVPVEDVEDIRLPKDAVMQEFKHNTDEEGHVASAYMRYTLPVRPYVRGGKVVMPRPERRKAMKKEKERDSEK